MGRGGSDNNDVLLRTRPELDPEEIQHLVREGLVLESRHPEADLWIYNYTNLAQYRDQWSETLRACRGLILDEQGEVIARGFPRFFDFRSAQSPRGNSWTVTPKLDGSLGILYPLGDGYRIATRGSFSSPQAIRANEMLGGYEIKPRPGQTPLFEIISPEHRVVVDYGRRQELVLLGAVDNRSGLDCEPPPWSGQSLQPLSPEDLGVSSLEELRALDEKNREGWVARFSDGRRAKVKFPGYVRLHKTVFDLDRKAIWDNLRHGDSVEDLIRGLPDETYGWIRKAREELREDFDRLDSLAQNEFSQAPVGSSRGEIAAYFGTCQTPSGILFDLLDGRDPGPRIWELVRPAPDRDESQ